jgi:spore germination cell wall hydrolase CwlJ-like protein
MKILSGIFNTLFGLTLAIGVFIFSHYPPTQVKADTTGNPPQNYLEIDNEFYIDMDNFATLDAEEFSCLVQNMYHEARSDGYAGMYAVALVTMNRVLDDRYPDGVCAVVKEGPVKESWKTRQHKDLADEERIYWPKKNKCQFSWYCDGKKDVMYDNDAFILANDIAGIIFDAWDNGYAIADITEGSTHYHASYVKPNWIHDRGMAKITQIGQHIFYRWGRP